MPDSRSPTPDPQTAAAVLDRVAQLGDAGLPLAAGLRAAADEAGSRRLRAGLRHVAGEIEKGRPLADVLADSRGLPPNLTGLVAAAQRSGHLGNVLSEWLANRRAARQHWRTVVGALAYPALTVVLAVFIYLLFAIAVVQPFKQLVEEFGIRLAVNTRVLFWVSETGLTVFLSLLGACVVLLIALRLIGGRAAWSWLITQLPLVGPAWHWSGAAEMLRSLALLVERQVPLPEALRLTGGGISDAHVGQISTGLAKQVEQGQPLHSAILDQRSLPLSIVPLLRWGEERGELPEALRSAAEMLAGRLQTRSVILVQVLPPLVFIGVAVLILSLFGMVATTLFTLIQGLT